jgi:guanylate kinase
MAKLFVITGPAGVGKSTISRKIAEASSKSALIEGDDLYSQIVGGYVDPWKEGNYLDTFWKLSLSSIRIYLEDGFDVVFNYIISPGQLNMIRKEFSDHEVRFTVLLVDEETIIERDKRRSEEYQMNERCIILLNEFKDHNYPENFILDTSHLTADETAALVLEDEKFILNNKS